MSKMSEIVPVNSNFHEISHTKDYKNWLESKSKRYHEYRAKWTDNPKGFVDEGFPLHLDIDASAACNLRCPMCSRTIMLKKNKSIQSAHFDFDLYKRLIDEAAELGIYSVKYNWLGEPLMNPRIVDMVKYAKDKGIEDTMMNTNAVLLSEKMSRDLINAGLDKLFFSFDSPYKESYEEIRVGAKYEDVLTNIKRFREIREEMGSLNPTTRVSMVLIPGKNENFIDDYVKLFSDIVDAIAYDDFIDHEKDCSFLDEKKDTRFSCAQLWQRIFVRPDGSIGICCRDHYTACGIGNINNMTLKEAWNSPVLKEIRDKHQNMKWHDVKLCSRCPHVLLDSSGSV
jgi:radical SAM protein with 4Fe4S-binding SPASM domain